MRMTRSLKCEKLPPSRVFVLGWNFFDFNLSMLFKCQGGCPALVPTPSPTTPVCLLLLSHSGKSCRGTSCSLVWLWCSEAFPYFPWMISLIETRFELEVEFNVHQRLRKFPLVCVVRKTRRLLISAPGHPPRRRAGGKAATKPRLN